MADLVAAGLTVNQFVHDITLGTGKVLSIVTAAPLPIKVQFTYHNKVLYYGTAGDLFPGAQQTLFTTVQSLVDTLAVPVDWTQVTQGTAIQVSTDNVTWTNAYLVAYLPGNPRPYLASTALPAVALTGTFYAYAKLV